MGKIVEKAKARLARRVAHYEEMIRSMSADERKAYKKPGSLKYKK